MLLELSVRNFAIIDSLRIRFAPGLNVLTGETGAGKSILVGALELLLGARAGADVVRTGEEEAVVEALFEIDARTAAGLGPALDAAGLSPGLEELVLKRSVARSGRGRVYLNGSLSTVTVLAGIAGEILSLYGQHEHQGLLRPERHIEILDSIAGLEKDVETYGGLHGEWRGNRESLGKLKSRETDREKRLDFLRFQKGEIERAKLVEGEEENLLRERKIQMNAQALLAAAAEANDLLYDGEGSAAAKIRAAQKRIQEISSVDESLAPGAAEPLDTALIGVEEVARTLTGILSRLSFDPGRLDEIESRLAEISKLKRKYGASVAEILAAAEGIGREISEIEGRDERIARLEAETKDQEARLRGLAGALSAARRRESAGLAAGMATELASLGMKRTAFLAQIEPEPDGALGPRGADRVRFLISPNPGEEARPLDRIASGGELSRILLALTRLLDTRARPMTVLFDEVDAGIGGAVAEVVGRKLQWVSRDHQVLCVTHLPQIASFADHHIGVWKEVVQKRTVTKVEVLDPEGRTREVARMLGGIEITQTTLEHAREMISRARGRVAP